MEIQSESCSYTITASEQQTSYFEPSHYVAHYNSSTEIHLCLMEMKQSYFVWIDIKEILPTTTMTTQAPCNTITFDRSSTINEKGGKEQHPPSSSTGSTAFSHHAPDKSTIIPSYHHYIPELRHLVIGVPGLSSSSDPTKGSAISLFGHDAITDIAINLSRRLGKFYDDDHVRSVFDFVIHIGKENNNNNGDEYGLILDVFLFSMIFSHYLKDVLFAYICML